MNQKILPSQYNQVIKRYLKYKSSEKVAKEFCVSGSAICRVLKKKGITLFNNRGRQYYFKQSLFDNGIISEDLAYILGIFYADGCNTGGSIVISLQEKDKDILKKIKKIFHFNGPFLINKRKKPHHQDRICLSMTSKHLSDSLNLLGMVERKSLILEFPSFRIVPKKFMSDFIRGYFDGDGGISYKKGGKSHVSFTGSESFCISLKNFLQEIGIKSYIGHYKKSLAKSVKLTSNQEALKLYKYMYKTKSSLFMLRKKKKYDFFIKDKFSKAEIIN